MNLLLTKVAVVVFCLPMYPLVIFSDWYQSKTSMGGSFNLKTSSIIYWEDVKEAVLYKRRP